MNRARRLHLVALNGHLLRDPPTLAVTRYDPRPAVTVYRREVDRRALLNLAIWVAGVAAFLALFSLLPG